MEPITATASLVAKPAIEGIIKNLVVPKIEAFCKATKLKYNEIMIPRGEHFQEYFNRAYRQYNIANMIVLKNTQNDLKSIYIPLTLLTGNSGHTENKSVLLDKFPVDDFNQIGKVLITDTAGMGKSTLSKRLFLDVIDKGVGIPIFIELRRLSSNKTIIRLILEQISSLIKTFDEDLMLKFISNGGFIFFLDGFDEIPFKEREFVISNVQDFVNKAGNNIFIMTSRPEASLVSFSDFLEMTICSLSKKEAYELLRKYDKQGDTSKLLIERIKQADYEMLDEFLKNPLLVSLLFIAFDYKQTIPLKKHIFYSQVFDAYFERHDLSKGNSYTHEKRSKLNIDDFRTVLSNIGFQCVVTNKVEYSKDELILMLDKARNDCYGISYASSDFFEDLLMAVPLFCRDGNYYKWVHKSLQEYFAALYISASDKKATILENILNSKRNSQYVNLLDIFYDIDIKSFRNVILCKLLTDYIGYASSKINTNTSISDDQHKTRMGILYKLKIYYCVNSKQLKTSSIEKTMTAFKIINEMASQKGVNLEDAHIVGAGRYRYYTGLVYEQNLQELFKMLYRKPGVSFIKHIPSTTAANFKKIIVEFDASETNLLNNEDHRLPHNQKELYGNFNSLVDICYLDIELVKDELKQIRKAVSDEKDFSEMINEI